MRFIVRAGQSKSISITPVLSDLDAPNHLAAAQARVAALTPEALEQLNARASRLVDPVLVGVVCGHRRSV